MALQSKTFTWGSYAWKSESNAYVLELVLTENSTNQDNNTSEVDYTLKLKSGGSNRFQCTVVSTLKLNGVQVASKSENKYLDYNASWTLLSGTATVTHGSDGSLNMPVEVSIDTTDSNQYAPPDKTCTWSWALTTIPRASSITGAGAVELGNACNVTWMPNSASFRYKLQFVLDSWSYTTGAIHPNKTSAYTYTGYTLPLTVAERITGDDHGTMTVTLTTYSDSVCANTIGSHSKTFTVTVPQNSETQPTVTMELMPISPIEGLYLQGISRVKAALSAEAKLGASIKRYFLEAEGSSYGDPYTTTYLTRSGELEITGCAVDSREIPGYARQTITVLPYSKPRLTGVAAYRCTAEGVAADNGEYLRIEATREYAPVAVDGVQNNFCSIRYRYRAENAEGFSDYVTILEADAEENSVVTVPLLNATFYKSTAYTVQINAVDTAEQETTVTVQIASEHIFQHKRAGGRGLGLGGYCQEDDLLEVHWNQRVHKDLRVDGRVNGSYMQSVELKNTRSFCIQSRFAGFNGTGSEGQFFMIVGNNAGLPVMGIVTVMDNGLAYQWSNDTLSVNVLDDGMIEIALSFQEWCKLTVISTDHFEIIQEE